MVHVEGVQADAAVRSDRLGQGKRLIVSVNEIGLEAVQWLDSHDERPRFDASCI